MCPGLGTGEYLQPGIINRHRFKNKGENKEEKTKRKNERPALFCQKTQKGEALFPCPFPGGGMGSALLQAQCQQRSSGAPFATGSTAGLTHPGMQGNPSLSLPGNSAPRPNQFIKVTGHRLHYERVGNYTAFLYSNKETILFKIL